MRLVREAITVPEVHQLVAPNLLGDRVSRATAWRVAAQLGWDDTTNAEYVAVAQLQADAFVTLDQDLVHTVESIVPTAPFEALLQSG